MGLPKFITDNQKKNKQKREQRQREWQQSDGEVGLGYILAMAGTVFNWPGELFGLARDIYENPAETWTFFTSYSSAIGSGHNATNIESLLRENGIRAWGGMNGDEYYISVPWKDAERARNILVSNGIPLVEKYANPPAYKGKK